MTDSELLIKLRVIAEGAQTIDQVKGELKKLTDEQKSSSATSASQTIASERLNKTMTTAMHVAGAFSVATATGRVSTESLIRIINLLTASFQTLGIVVTKVVPWVQLLFIVGQVAKGIHELTSTTDAQAAASKRAGESAEDYAKRLEDLDGKTLENIKQQFVDIATATAAEVTELERVQVLIDKLQDAKLSAEIAKINARTDISPEQKQTEISNLKLKYGLDAIDRRRKTLEGTGGVIDQAEDAKVLASKEVEDRRKALDQLRKRDVSNLSPEDQGQHEYAIRDGERYVKEAEKNRADTFIAQNNVIENARNELHVLGFKQTEAVATNVGELNTVAAEAKKREDEKRAQEAAAAAKEKAEAAKEQQRVLDEQLKQARAREKAGFPALQASANKEQSEAEAARGKLNRLEQTHEVGGRRYSERDPTYQRAHREALARADKEVEEANAALGKLAAANAKMAAVIQGIVTVQEQQAAQLRNTTPAQ